MSTLEACAPGNCALTMRPMPNSSTMYFVVPLSRENPVIPSRAENLILFCFRGIA
ncbi:MAG: hypothetical protein QOH24_1836 [Verrucomicrobiota bacterium]